MTADEEANPAEDAPSSAALERLAAAIDHAAHYLPAQGPITVFIHHNTLHAFEDLPFDEAVQKGARVFGCQPYLLEERFRQELAKGRIRLVDLAAELRLHLGKAADAPVLEFGTRFDLRMAMLQYPLRVAPAAELRWFVAETDALSRFRRDVPEAIRTKFLEETRHWAMRDVRDGGGKSRDKRLHAAMASLLSQFGEASIERWNAKTWESFSMHALWRICRDGVHGVKPVPHPTSPVRHRDVLLAACGEDSDRLVGDLLIRFCASFLDQGFSTWPLPEREAGFYRAFDALYRQPCGPPDAWLRGLPAELARIAAAGLSPLASIHESLELLGVREAERDEFLTGTLLALRGWAGMVREVEMRSDRVARPIPAGSLVEFVAIRLLLDRLALAHIAANMLDYQGPLQQLRDRARHATPKPDFALQEQRAFLVYKIAQSLGWTPGVLYRLGKSEWSTLVHEIESFSGVERRQVFQHAYERRYRTQILDAIATHSRGRCERIAAPRFQVLTCLDEREESFRRHLEELAPNSETFGLAGFFSVPMYYRGAADAHYVPLCPVVIRPQHWVEEDVVYTFEDEHRRRALTRKALGTASHQIHVGSRTFAGGALLTALFGVLATIPLVARVLFPRITAQIRSRFGKWVQPPPATVLQLERSHPEPKCEEGHLGFSVDEMLNMGERVLRDIGLTRGFARFVFVFGHGSNSVNNPHKSAYDCGACGGSAGGPNARVLAQILNDRRVRDGLLERGIDIPQDTTFVSALHNTGDDSLTYADLDQIAKPALKEFEQIREVLERACDRNAHERARRFVSAPLDMTFPAARRHVEGRAADLSQTRPECGHATNAICYVGRRDRVRGLYLDRRAFLTSYDPEQDDAEATILGRILAAAVPVCAGINLEYYFSYVDPAGFGCATKLPHNVSALLGVMDGAASDLRTGLPWQMVEIHEPVRLLFVIETTPAKMLALMARDPVLDRHVRHGWVQLAVLDARSSNLQVFESGGFVPYVPESTTLPEVKSSVDWYRGWREHLSPAVVVPPPLSTSAYENGNGHANSNGNGNGHG